MIKIKAFYDKNLKQLKIPVLLKTPHKRIISDFVVDTGSPHTILNYSNSRRLDIPYIEKVEIVKLGGRAYQSYLFEKLEVIFKSIENKEIKVEIPMRVLKPNSFKMEEIGQLDRCPNLLGLDFLEKGHRFFCDLAKLEIYFEKDN